jgi:hypothetical protein
VRRVVMVSALALALAVGVVQPVRAAHQSTAAEPAAGASLVLSHGQGPGLPAQSVPGAPPPVNLGDYRFCARPSTYKVSGPPTPISAYLAGFSDTRKLGGAVPVGYPTPAFAQSEGKAEGLQTNTPTYRGHLFLCSLITLQLDQGGQFQLPPLTATLLGFGFEPVTATAILYQIAPPGQRPPPLKTVVYSDEGPAAVEAGNAPITAVATARLGLRVTSVQVDGVPLDVGPSCHTTAPLFTPGNPVAPGELMLTGGDYPGDPVPSFGGALAGGTFTGEADIPPLTGCVTPSGENLDPLLTASLSGPGNYVRQVIGAVCFPTFHDQCTSADLPSTVPLWTVTHGGPYTSSAPSSGPLTFIVNTPAITGGLTITCTRSQIAGAFADVTGPSRGGLATVNWVGTAGCSAPANGSTWSIVQQGTSFLGPHTFAAGVTTGNVDDMVFRLTEKTGTQPGCHALMEGYEGATYSNAGSELSLLGSPDSLLVIQSNCRPDVPVIFTGPGTDNGEVTVTATYPLLPGGYDVTSP